MASYLQAKTANGLWFLRVDDIDPPREPAGTAAGIIKSLDDHGFVHDGPVQYQSARSNRYEQALATLAAEGRVYGCDCTRKKLSQLKTRRYPGTCRSRSLPLTQHAVRFLVPLEEVSFHDRVMGTCQQALADDVGDFVLKRRDGLISYQLANVVDDGVDQITEIVRGADLLDNTPRQIALAQALQFPLPAYLHVPVAVNTDGQKLSKQTQARALDECSVVSNLLSAWDFLGQTRFPEQVKPAQYGSSEAFWQMAFRLWDATRIPPVQNKVADTELL